MLTEWSRSVVFILYYHSIIIQVKVLCAIIKTGTGYLLVYVTCVAPTV